MNNKIIINATQFNELLKWRDLNRELVGKFIPALWDGEIIVNSIDGDEYSRTEFHVRGDVSQGYITDITFGHAMRGRGEFNIVSYEIITGTKDAPKGASLVNLKQIHNKDLYEATKEILWHDTEVRALHSNMEDAIVQDVLTTFATVNAYLFHYKSDWDDVETREVKRNVVKKKGKFKYSGKPAVIIGRKYSLKKPVKQSAIPKYKQWKETCWGVRGHYRHLKNGRVVSIKPYLKGKDRMFGASNNREYKINKVSIKPIKDSGESRINDKEDE